MIRLTRILNKTLRKLYGIRPVRTSERQKSIRTLSEELQTWKQELPAYLDPELVDPSVLGPLFQRQNNLLSLAYAHATILIYRPNLFHEFCGQNREQLSQEILDNVRSCVDAAMLIVSVVERMVNAGQFYDGSWVPSAPSLCLHG